MAGGGQGGESGFEFWRDAGVDAGVGPPRMVTVEDSPWNRWRLHQVLGHMSWTKIWTAGFGTKLSLYINTCASGSHGQHLGSLACKYTRTRTVLRCLSHLQSSMEGGGGNCRIRRAGLAKTQRQNHGQGQGEGGPYLSQGGFVLEGSSCTAASDTRLQRGGGLPGGCGDSVHGLESSPRVA